MPQKFGARDHTGNKLDKLEDYLRVFTQVLKNQPFELVYFDAFAGTPEIDVGENSTRGFFVDDVQPLLKGSSERAVKFGAKFGRYIFVDSRRRNVCELEALKGSHPEIADRIEIRRADANNELLRFCAIWPKMQRAVVFLDPFGNQVAWETIEAIAATEAIDLWYLFPAGLGVHRQLGNKDAEASLDRLFGTTEWRTAFYEKRTEQDLFQQKIEEVPVATPESITKFTITRMKTIFQGGVLDEWLPLGSNGRHSYSLIFACANPNPKANQLARRLAKAVLKSRDNGRVK